MKEQSPAVNPAILGFGDGVSDGNVTISTPGTTTLTVDKFYDTLTLDATAGDVIINAAGYRIFAKTLINAIPGANHVYIRNNGGNGGNGSGTPGSLGAAAPGGTLTAGAPGLGGGGPGAGSNGASDGVVGAAGTTTTARNGYGGAGVAGGASGAGGTCPTRATKPSVVANTGGAIVIPNTAAGWLSKAMAAALGQKSSLLALPTLSPGGRAPAGRVARAALPTVRGPLGRLVRAAAVAGPVVQEVAYLWRHPPSRER